MQNRICKKYNYKALLIFILIIIIYFFIQNAIATEPPKIEWEKTYGGSANDEGYSMDITSDKGCIITGYTSSYGDGGKDVWLIKVDSNGNEIWNRTFGGDEDDIGWDVKETTDGGYIIVGRTSSYGNGAVDVWLIKTDDKGNKVWDKTFGGTASEEGRAVQQTLDGGYIIAGRSRTYTESGAWLIKTNSKGEKNWDKLFDNAQYSNDIQQTNDGGYILLGEDQLIKTDGDGNLERYRNLYRGNSVKQTNDGGYIITGGMEWGWYVYILKLDSELEEEWDEHYVYQKNGQGQCVQQTCDGGYIITGGNSSYLYVIKMDSLGNKYWEMTFSNRTTGDMGYSIHQISVDEDFIIAGSAMFREGFHTGYDVLLIKLSYNTESSSDDESDDSNNEGDNTDDAGNDNDEITQEDDSLNETNDLNINKEASGDEKGTPGFEFVLTICVLFFILLLKRKRN